MAGPRLFSGNPEGLPVEAACPALFTAAKNMWPGLCGWAFEVATGEFVHKWLARRFCRHEGLRCLDLGGGFHIENPIYRVVMPCI